MIPSFDSPYPIDSVQSTRRDAADLIATFFKTLDLPNSTHSHGYGMDLNLHANGWTLKSHPFCWCEHSHCAYCNSSFDPEDLGLSAHDLFEGTLAKNWQDKGFVEGQGAPNLWLSHEDGRDVKIWWYKYAGRAMVWSASPGITWEDMETMLPTLAPDFAKVAQHHLLCDAIANLTKTVILTTEPSKTGDRQHVAYRTKNEIPATDLALMSTNTILALYETLLALHLKAKDHDNAQRILTERTKMPAQSKDGHSLSLDWRLRKLLDDPKRNLKTP